MAIEFTNNVDKIKSSLDKGISEGLLEFAIKVRGAIQSRGDHPVETGALRQSWDYEPKNPTNEIEVGNYMEYAGYVENGDVGNKEVGRKRAKTHIKKDKSARGNNPQHPGLKGFNDVKNDFVNTMQNAINRNIE